MATTSFGKLYHWAFVFDEAAARELDAAITRFLGQPPKYEVRLSDRTRLECDSLAELLAFSNPPLRAITRLHISGDNRPRSVTLRFDAKSALYSTDVDARGSDEQILLLRRDIEDVLTSIRPGYWPVAWFVSAWPIVIFTLATGGFMVASVLVYFAQLQTRVFGGWIIATVIISSILFISSIAFPVGVFELGQGTKRHTVLKSRRNIIGVGIIGAAVVGGFVTLAIDFAQKHWK